MMRKTVKQITTFIILVIIFSFVLSEIAIAADYQWPTDSHEIVSGRGFKKGSHSAIDIKVASGKPVYASSSGRVYAVYTGCNNHSGRRNGTCQARGLCSPSNGNYYNGYCNNGTGNGVVILHDDGIKTRYAHLTANSITVKVGDRVSAGQVIGEVGDSGNASGPHLHFATYRSSSSYFDPMNLLNSCTNHVKGQYLWPEDAHPHYQYYTCANCGAKFTDGSTTTMSNCSQCNIIVEPPVPQPQIGYINCPGKNLVINSEPSPGHKIISVPHGEQITIYPDKSVGNWYWVEYNGVQGYSSKNFISDSPTVTKCTNHVKGEFQWFEAAHPHYNHYACATCGADFTDDSTTKIDSCVDCNPGPMPPTLSPLNTPQVSLGSSSIKEGDSLYVSWTSSGEGAEYEITWSGTGGAGSAWNIYDTYDTIDGMYFGTAGDYKLKVSASRDGQTVESGYVYFTVQPKGLVYGIVTGTNGKNLAINDAPGASPEHSNKVGRIPPGGVMAVFPARTSGNWYWVEYNGIYGYAYKKYITLQ